MFAHVPTDAVLLFSDGRVETHRFLLAELSPVFRAMYFGSETNTGVVELKEHSKSTFTFILAATQAIMQSKERDPATQLTADNVRPVLAFAHQFQMEAWVNKAQVFLIDRVNLPFLSAENLLFCETYELDNLMRRCAELFWQDPLSTDIKMDALIQGLGARSLNTWLTHTSKTVMVERQNVAVLMERKFGDRDDKLLGEEMVIADLEEESGQKVSRKQELENLIGRRIKFQTMSGGRFSKMKEGEVMALDMHTRAGNKLKLMNQFKDQAWFHESELKNMRVQY
jgi:hypothetical protein